MHTRMVVNDKTYVFIGDTNAYNVLVEPVEAERINQLSEEIERIKELSLIDDFLYVGVEIKAWNQELSPWRAPAIFGKEDFGDGAIDTLDDLIQLLIKMFGVERNYILGGYSLAGLFALWSGYQTELFSTLVAASPSVWFENWDTFMETHTTKANVYLSLGDQEEKAKNQTLQRVGDRIRKQYELLHKQNNCVLERNPGNHFVDDVLRVAKGFAWALKQPSHTR